MTLRQEVEVHEIHAESDYDKDDDGPVAGAVAVEPFENLPHRSVPLTVGPFMPRFPASPALVFLVTVRPAVIDLASLRSAASPLLPGQALASLLLSRPPLLQIPLPLLLPCPPGALDGLRSPRHDPLAEQVRVGHLMTARADLGDVPGDLRCDESAEAVIIEVFDLNRPVDPDSEPLEVVPLEPVDLCSADDVVHLGVRGRPGADPAGVRRHDSVSRRHWSEEKKSKGFEGSVWPHYVHLYGEAITFQALRRCLESAGPCGLSGESGGSEGLASATTDNRPMSIDVYRAPAPGPSAPKPPGQPAIGGGLV